MTDIPIRHRLDVRDLRDYIRLNPHVKRISFPSNELDRMLACIESLQTEIDSLRKEIDENTSRTA